MAELLLELFSEEIPARLQPWAETAFAARIEALLKDQGLWSEKVSVQCYSTPRRLWLYSPNLPEKSADTVEERRGPRVDAPDKAIEGFLKSVGLARSEVEEREEKKGVFLYAVTQHSGRPAAGILAAELPRLIGDFRWPKSMRWGEGTMRWVRPLHSILCLLDGKVLDFSLGGIRAGNTTKGHRSRGGEDITIASFADYIEKLSRADVILMRQDRIATIGGTAKELAIAEGLELVEDAALLEEVAGLVEWPVVLLGSFDEDFLELPPEVLISEMRHHQKYFALRDPATGKLAPRFIFASNLLADDGCKAIRRGNERVLSARLSDARFFWDQDRKVRLEDRLPALDDIVFHQKLGSVGERSKRIETLAAKLSAFIPGCDERQAARAAKLAKADLVSGMVGEFPDLQGVMGGYYAEADGEGPEVAAAIRDHYSPKGPSDACPSEPVSVAVALADKLDLLVGLFGIGEKPTGSKDPYALRRAALGAIRLIVENGLRIGLKSDLKLTDEVVAFLAERLKVQQREKGVRHDLVDAVFALGGEDDLVRLLARVGALQDFLGTPDGENLLAGYKRAGNIVRIEEKKDKAAFDQAVEPGLLTEADEIALFDGLEKAASAVSRAVSDEGFSEAMAAVAKLRAPIDAFFDTVTVNTGDAGLRANRLRLLSMVRSALDEVADFSKIEG
ncbi:MAG: glycine--tRNA ligase subunit beta [Sphingomonadales bacterium]